MKQPNLETLIKAKRFDWTNPSITPKNFPVPVDYTPAKEYKLFHFNRYISSDEAIAEIKKEQWEPATIFQLLEWPDWNGIDLIVALGSVAKIDGNRRVPCLDEDGSERSLRLFWGDGGWRAGYRFLAVRTQSLESGDSVPLTLGNSDTSDKKPQTELEALKLRVEKLESLLNL